VIGCGVVEFGPKTTVQIPIQVAEIAIYGLWIGQQRLDFQPGTFPFLGVFQHVLDDPDSSALIAMGATYDGDTKWPVAHAVIRELSEACWRFMACSKIDCIRRWSISKKRKGPPIGDPFEVRCSSMVPKDQ
jgi:hypothetical protein